MNEVVRILPGKGSRSPDAMLECAKTVNLLSVTIIGWTEDGFFFSSSYAKKQDILWDLKQAEIELLKE